MKINLLFDFVRLGTIKKNSPKLLKAFGSQLCMAGIMFFFTVTCNQLHAQTFPAGFSRVQVTATGSTVTGMTFAPDGRIFIAHQDGRIRLYKNGVLSTMLTLSGVRSGGEDGLSAIRVDPNFATNNYIYVCYTTTGLVNRLARLTLSGDAVVAQLTLRDFPLLSTTAQRHNGGGIRFKDGYLYISIGENDVPSAAQSKTSYGGKVLRLNAADGSPAVGNPYYSDANVITKCIWSMGERNPWSMDISPSTGKVYICNVGQTFAEEINDVTTAGTNSGHPTVEGNSTNPAFKNPVYYVTNPNYTPVTTAEGCAIIGGAFLESPVTNYPATYVGKFFYMDYCNNWINYINPSTGAYTNFGTGVGAASPYANSTTLGLGVDGNLYYAQGGTIYKVIYTNVSAPAITNQPVSVTVTEGQSASFSVNASGATPMTFQWKKSGVNITGATSSTYTIPAVTATNAGSYTVTATNSFGSATSTAATLTVLAYNAPPVATIITPASGTTYYYGQTIGFSGSATDQEDGALPASAFKWGLFFDHNGDHSHDLATAGLAVGSKTGSFDTTVNEIDSNVSYRLVLTVTDANGLTGTASVSVIPQLSTVSFATQPAGLKVNVNGKSQTTPYSVVGVEGNTFDMGADQFQTLNGVSYEFDSWVHGGTMNQSFSVPTNNTTYTAVFKEVATTNTTLTATKDLYVRDGANAAINYGATAPTLIETKMDVTANSGYNREGYLGFDLSTISGTINSAKIKVYGKLGATGTAIPVGMYSVSSTTWAETTTNWNNKPAASATALATTSISSITPAYYLWDVTAYINTEKAAGRNLVSFNFKNLANAASQCSWNTKESGSNAPQLEVISTPIATPSQSPYGGVVKSIPGQIEAEQYDLGGQGIAYNDLTVGNTPNQFRTDDVDIETTTGGGYNIGYADPGEWLEYTVNVTASGAYNLEFRVAAIVAGRTMHLEIDGVNISGTVTVPVGTGWQDFKSVVIPNVMLTSGQKIMRIVMDTGSANLNYVNITASTQLPYTGTAIAIPGKVEVENYDLGGQNIAYNDLSAGNLGNAYRTTENVDIQLGSDLGVALYNSGYTAAGEWMEYTVNVTTAGTYSFQARVASTVAGKSFHIEMDGVTVATIAVPNTGGWQNWQTVTVSNVALTAGNKIMRLFMDTDQINIDYVNVVNTSGARFISSSKGGSTEAAFTDTLLYPNPTQGIVTLRTQVQDKATVSISIYTVSGNLVLSKDFQNIQGAFEESINITHLPTGIYAVQLKKGNTIETKKLIKN